MYLHISRGGSFVSKRFTKRPQSRKIKNVSCVHSQLLNHPSLSATLATR